MNVFEYLDMLEKNLEPFLEEHYPNGAIFQEDVAPAPAHSAMCTRENFIDAG